MLRILIAVFSFLVFISSSAYADNEKAGIAALINDTSNPYWQTFYDGVKETGEELEQAIDIYVLGNATDAEGQLNQCEVALLKKPKAMLFAAVNGINLGPCLRKANEQGVILVDVDGNVDQALAAQMGVTLAFSVASNNYELGVKAAHYLDGKSGKVLILEGLPGSQPSRLRVQGFNETLPEGLEVIAGPAAWHFGWDPADWDRLKAGDITGRILAAHPDLTAIFAANDTMALGAVEALRAAGHENVIVIGVDGVADAVTSIKEGRLNASIAQLPYLMGREAVIKTVKQLAGEETYDFQQYVPILTLDKETLENGDNDLLQYLR